MSRFGIGGGIGFYAAGLLLVAACSATPTAKRLVSAEPAGHALALDEVLSRPADVTVTLHPPAIVRDRVYGPLLKRAFALAAGYAGPRSLGTTALVALERTEEVDAAVGEGGEALILLRGVPADLDVTKIVDEAGRPVWKLAVLDVRQSFIEYQGASASGASLFVLPQRIWVVAAGAATARTRQALVESTGPVSFAATDVSLAELSIRGAALVRRDERLRTGALAPLGSSLVRASFGLTPGLEGVIVARLFYGEDTAAAEGAEKTAREVVAAFRQSLEKIEKSGGQTPSVRVDVPPLSWLAAAGVARTGATVSVRAPIPRAWLDAIALANIPSSALGEEGDPAAKSEVPWALWRRPASAPTLTLPRTAPTHPARAQEPSQAGGSL
jgi:hypothetical protein